MYHNTESSIYDSNVDTSQPWGHLWKIERVSSFSTIFKNPILTPCIYYVADNIFNYTHTQHTWYEYSVTCDMLYFTPMTTILNIGSIYIHFSRNICSWQVDINIIHAVLICFAFRILKFIRLQFMLQVCLSTVQVQTMYLIFQLWR